MEVDYFKVPSSQEGELTINRILLIVNNQVNHRRNITTFVFFKSLRKITNPNTGCDKSKLTFYTRFKLPVAGIAFSFY